jgi:hypothetical protein
MPSPVLPLNGPLPTAVGLFVVLLLVGSTVAVVVRFLPVPYESVLALVGAIIGVALGQGTLPSIGGDLILFVLLPGLLFDAGYRLRWPLLRQNLIPSLPWPPPAWGSPPLSSASSATGRSD